MMKISGRIAAVLVLCLLFPAAGAGAEDEWEHLYTRDGLDVFQKSIPGSTSHAFKAFGFVDAKLEVVGSVIRDVASYPGWVPRCKRIVVLEDIDFNNRIFYSVVDTPPPFKDRDMILKNETIYDLEKGVAEISFHIVDQELIPLSNKYFRVTELSGEYLLEYFGRDKTRITFEYRGDPGGKIPVRLADWIECRHYPYDNIMGIKRMAKEQRYIEAGLESPDRELIEAIGNDINLVGKILKNRIGDYIIDKEMLDIIFDSQTIRKMIRKIHEERTTFESIQNAVASIFTVAACNPAVASCIEDKQLEDIICLDALMREKWLVDLIVKNRQEIERCLNAPNGNLEKIFYKVAASDKAVRTFIKDDDLARTIMNSESVRTRLWRDKELINKILDRIIFFESVRDFEKIIEDRVDTYE